MAKVAKVNTRFPMVRFSPCLIVLMLITPLLPRPLTLTLTLALPPHPFSPSLLPSLSPSLPPSLPPSPQDLTLLSNLPLSTEPSAAPSLPCPTSRFR